MAYRLTIAVKRIAKGFASTKAEPIHFSGQKSEFADIKGALTQLLWRLGYPFNQATGLSLENATGTQPPYCKAGVCLAIHAGSQVIGYLGAVDTSVLKAFSVKQAVYFFEIDLEYLVHIPRVEKYFSGLARYPATSRDISLVVPEQLAAGELLESVRAQKQKYVEAAQLFDVYRGEPLAQGEKSVSLSITYRSSNATLDDATVDKIHNKIVQALMLQFNARYRKGLDV